MYQMSKDFEVKPEKINEISWAVGQHMRGALVQSKVSLFASIYLATRCIEEEIESVDALKKYVEEKLDDKRALFVSDCIKGQYDAVISIANSFKLSDLLGCMYFIGKIDGRGEIDWSTPKSIIDLSIKILNISDGDKVADFGCGFGDFLLDASVNKNAEFFGIDINTASSEIASIRSEYFMEDIALEQGDMFSIDENKMFNKIFSNYPFGMRLKELHSGMEYLDKIHKNVPDIKRATSSDWVYNTLIMDHLDDDGKAVAIMTNGSTWNSIDLKVREYFVRNGYIEAIVALPAKLFNMTSIPTTLIVLSHNNDKIRMVDAQELCVQGRRQNEMSEDNIAEIYEALMNDSHISKAVSIDELQANEFVLNPARYLEKQIVISDGVEFGSIMKRITRGAPIKASDLDEMVSDVPTDTQYLMLANIQNGIISDDLPYLKDLDSKLDKYCIGHKNLLLSKNGAPFKVAVAEVAEGRKILGNGNLFIIELDEEKVNPYFIKAFFDSELGSAALQKITVGATIPNISAESLRKMLVPLPAMEKQVEIAEKYQAKVDEIKILNLKLQKAQNDLKNIFGEE